MLLKINLHLLHNANELDAAEQEEFANWLLKVEEGHIPTYAIFAPKKEHVNAINATIITQFSDEAVEYLSADIIKNQTESNHQYSIEFLNSLIIG
ncbi:2077_t:CDS:2, partial [Cetraspora pellucida]